MTDRAPDSFERLVADIAVASIGNTFNFLRDVDPELDVDGGPVIRRENLLSYLGARSDAVIVGLGEAAGFAGARWSGIAFTSERTLASWGAPYAPSSRAGGRSEQSATIVHRVLTDLDVEEHTLLWNTVPTHPRRSDEPLTNRTPSVAEIAAGAVYARRLITLLEQPVVVAIGRKAGDAIGPGVRCIRHPANAGAADFEDGMRRIVEELRKSGRLPPSRNGRASLYA